MANKYDSLTPKLGDKGSQVTMLQRALRESVDHNLKVDSDFGNKTKTALEQWQKSMEVDVTGQYTGETKEILDELIGKRFLQEWRYAQVAKEVNRDVKQFTALAKSISTVESKYEGFTADGSVTLLFERHKFYNLLRARLAQKPAEIDHIENHYQVTLGNPARAIEHITKHNPEICNPKSGGYRVGQAEIDRFKTATSINPFIATESASFGLYQIMGFNAKHCGYTSGMDMLTDFMESEYKHLLAFAKFLEATPAIYTNLRSKNYAGIAKLYNGPSYAKNQYHTKIKNALSKFGF